MGARGGTGCGDQLPWGAGRSRIPFSGFPAHPKTPLQVALGDRQPPAPVRGGHGVG